MGSVKFGEFFMSDLCCDSLGIHVLSATYVLNGGCQSLKGLQEPFFVGKFVGKNSRVATALSMGIEHRTAVDPVPAAMG